MNFSHLLPAATARLTLLARFAVFASLGMLTRFACADTVTLSPAAAGDRSYVVEGTIIDYRGDRLVMEPERSSPGTGNPGTGKKSYPADRVVAFTTAWPAEYETAQQAMRERRWSDAASELRQATRNEKRDWAKRWFATDLMRCQLAMGQASQAGDLLIALDAADPKTPAWQLAPLPWYATNDVSQRDAQKWLNRREEAARLLGAAWLLNTNQRTAARVELQSLARSTHASVAALAECQLWRLNLMQADRRQADRWATRLTAMPTNIAAGPRHLLAQAYLRQKRYDEAALAALRDTLQPNPSHRLKARSLLLAARALIASERTDEAHILLGEILQDYPDTPIEPDAQALLKPAQ